MATITNGYCTLKEIKSALRVTDSLDDPLLSMAVESASRLIDSYTSRTFYSVTSSTRLFVPQDNFVCEIDDAIAISLVEVNDDSGWETWQTASYQKEPLNGIVDGLTGYPTTRLRAIADQLFVKLAEEATVRVTATWGFATIPTAVKQATIIQASRIYKRLDSPLGVAGFGDLGAIRVSSRLDPDVAQLVDPYRKIRFV